MAITTEVAQDTTSGGTWKALATGVANGTKEVVRIWMANKTGGAATVAIRLTVGSKVTMLQPEVILREGQSGTPKLGNIPLVGTTAKLEVMSVGEVDWTASISLRT